MWIRLSLVMFLAGCAQTPASVKTGPGGRAEVEVKPTLAVAPLALADEELAWIGEAIAEDFEERLIARADLNFCSLRQVFSALRQARLTPADLERTPAQQSLGRHLGASHVIVGQLALAGERLLGRAKVVAVQSGQVLAELPIDAPRTDLAQVEDQLARTLATVVGGKLDRAGAPPPLAAVEQTTRARRLLRPQSLSPRSANPDVSLGIAQEKLEQATALANQATEAAPDFATAWATLALAAAIDGEEDRAHELLAKAEALRPGACPLSVLARCFTFMRQGKFEDAEQVLGKAHGDHPGFLHARGSLAELLLHFGRMRESRAAFQKYLAAVPRQPWVMVKMAYIDARLDQNQQALALTRQAVAIIPDSTYLQTELASRQIDVGDLPGAQATLEKVLASAPELISAQVRLGYVQLLAGDDAAAIATSHKAIAAATDPRDRRERGYAHLNLARAYGHQSDVDKSLEHLATARSEADVGLEEFEADPALEAVRNDPRYMEIVD